MSSFSSLVWLFGVDVYSGTPKRSILEGPGKQLDFEGRVGIPPFKGVDWDRYRGTIRIKQERDRNIPTWARILMINFTWRS